MVVMTLAVVFALSFVFFRTGHWTIVRLARSGTCMAFVCVAACRLRDCRIDIVVVKISGLYFVAIHQRKFLLGCIELDVE